MPKESKNIEEEISIEESYILYGTEKVPEKKTIEEKKKENGKEKKDLQLRFF